MIDWNRVRELKVEIGEEDFAEVAEVFLEEVEAVLDRLRAAPNPATYEPDLHFLKSSAVNLGFSEFGRLCQIGERAAAAGKAESVDLRPIFATFASSKNVFLAG